MLAALVLCPAAPLRAQNGWVTILDAKSFKDWKVAPESPSARVEETATEKRVVAGDSLRDGRWTFKDGVLHGEGGVSHIFSPRGDYENFSTAPRSRSRTRGTAGSTSARRSATASRTATRRRSTALTPTRCALEASTTSSKVTDMLVPPDTWFTQEVTAVGNHIVIKVNGKTTVDFVDEKNTHTKGHFAFQQHNLGSEVWIRNVRVKELPAK